MFSFEKCGVYLCMIAFLLAFSSSVGQAEEITIEITHLKDFNDQQDEDAPLLWSIPLEGSEMQTAGIVPDANCTYWTLSLPTLATSIYGRVRFELRGEFPLCRFFNIHAYDEYGVFHDALADFEFLPEQGSQNPFALGQLDRLEGEPDRFRARVVFASPIPRPFLRAGFSDTLYAPAADPAQPQKYFSLCLRIYVGTGTNINEKDRRGGVNLPRVYYVYDTEEMTSTTPTSAEEIAQLLPDNPGIPIDFLLQCEALADARSERLLEEPYTPVPGYSPVEGEWYRVKSMIGVLNRAFPGGISDRALEEFAERLLEPPLPYQNIHGGYIATFLDPVGPRHEVAVVQIRIPRVWTAENLESRPIDVQTRYISIMVYQTLNFFRLQNGLMDREFLRDTNNSEYVTIVFSRAEDKPRNIASYNWLPYGSSVPFVGMRWALSESNFQESPLHYEDEDPYQPDSSKLRKHMKSYYPVIRYMSTAEFEKFGPDGAGLPVAGDFDGDGYCDPAMVDSSGNWYFWLSIFNYTRGGPYPMSSAGATPLAADFDADNLADPVWVDDSGLSTMRPSSVGYLASQCPVSSIDREYEPVSGDFDGDRKADQAGMDSAGNWIFYLSTSGYGLLGPVALTPSGGTPLAADFDGDGRADPTVVDGSGNWTVCLSSAGYASFGPYALTSANRMAVAGDFDGDGRADPAAMDSSGYWIICFSRGGYAPQGPHLFTVP